VKSLLHKILLASLLVILLPVALAFVWTSGTLSSLVEHRVMEKAAAQAARLRLLLEEKKEIATGVVSWIAEVPALQKQFDEKDRRVLFQMLSPLLGSTGLLSLKPGKIFASETEPIPYPGAATNVFQFEDAARTKLTPAMYHFIADGADDMKTLRANRAAFDKLQIRARRLVDVSNINIK